MNYWFSHKAMGTLSLTSIHIWPLAEMKISFPPLLGLVNNEPLFWILSFALTSFLFVLILISSKTSNNQLHKVRLRAPGNILELREAKAAERIVLSLVCTPGTHEDLSKIPALKWFQCVVNIETTILKSIMSKTTRAFLPIPKQYVGNMGTKDFLLEADTSESFRSEGKGLSSKPRYVAKTAKKFTQLP